MEEVNRNVRRRPYEARDKEILISQIIELHTVILNSIENMRKWNFFEEIVWSYVKA